MNITLSFSKRVKLGILLVVLPILIVWGAIYMSPLFIADLGGPIEYSVRINLIDNGEELIDDPVNLTLSEVLGVPILHNILEEFLSNDSITSLFQIISREEAEPLTALFDNKGYPLTESRDFFYQNKLFEIHYLESISCSLKLSWSLNWGEVITPPDVFFNYIGHYDSSP